MQDDESSPASGFTHEDAVRWLEDHLGDYVGVWLAIDYGGEMPLIVVSAKGDLERHPDAVKQPAIDTFSGWFQVGTTDLIINERMGEFRRREAGFLVGLGPDVTLSVFSLLKEGIGHG